MMMATRNDIKDRLIHNQSPYPTKDKVLSYTIPIDHSENLLFCSSAASGSQDNGSLSFITSDDDPCNGRDSLASFLDEGLGTSLDGVDEIASPIFPTLGRNDSGVYANDDGLGTIGIQVVGTSTTGATHPHASLIPPPISSSASSCSSILSTGSSGGVSNNSNLISVAEVVSWKGCPNSSNSNPGSILLSPATATISVVTDATTGIPSIVCTSTANSGNNCGSSSSNYNIPTVKLEGGQGDQSNSTTVTQAPGKGTSLQQQQRCKSMPLGRQGPQKCTICDKVFSNASALTKHKLTHSDERRHACATCGKAFKRQDHLNGHMLTHRNKKPFECKSKGCGKSYCDARSLRRHVENRHGHEVLESMNLTSHHTKHSNKNNHNQQNNANSTNNNSQDSPQLELTPETTPPAATVTFTSTNKPVITSGSRVSPHGKGNGGGQSQNNLKISLDCMPVLQPEQPQLQVEGACPEKINSQPQPPVLQKAGGDNNTNGHILTTGGTTVPIVIKRENVSVFDFDENMEDVQTHEKLLSSIPNPTIKVGGIIDSNNKLAPLPDIRLIQEWTKRLGDSKVALFLASSTAASSIAQLAGPMASIQLDGQIPTINTAMAGGNQGFIPVSENGLYSVTPISLVPTSSGEFTFKPANLAIPTSESPKPLYIVPSDPLIQNVSPTITVPAGVPISSTGPCNFNVSISNGTISSSPVVIKQEPQTGSPPTKNSIKESKCNSDKVKSGIGPTLANRIKTKLKAGSLKKMANKANNNTDPNKSDSDRPKQSIVINKSTTDELGAKQSIIISSPQQSATTMMGSMPTITITAGGGITTWCESPNAMDEDRLSEGADGDDKPVECSICCRRFKNTPALNGHMRLHGGYFKKETDGSKKKDQVSKEPAHSTPLQTVSVSVRALIEEKIKERRNNLLKLAAEKASSEEGASTENSSQPPSTTNHANSPTNNNGKAKSERNKSLSQSNASTSGNETKRSTSPPNNTNNIAQQSKLLVENVKLKLEPKSPEKDRNCDQDTNNVLRTFDNSANNSSTSVVSSAIIDPTFQDLSILIGDGSFLEGVGMNNNGTAGFLPPLIRDPLMPSSNPNGFQMDKTNFTLLDCGINPDDFCQAFHLVYVDNNGTDMPIAMDQETLGKVSRMFQETLPDLSAMTGNTNDNQSLKGVVEPMVCAPHDDPCNLPWEWRNSTSSDNTENSLGNVQDCVNSLLCSSSAETPDDSSTKDPVAGGGFCYTPILSPNSSFCLTPGPDSPFEATSHSLSFICPSPSIGTGSAFNEPPASNLVDPPSVEPLFSSESQPLSNSVNISVNMSPLPESGFHSENNLPKYTQIQQQQQQPLQQMSGHTYMNSGFDGSRQGSVAVSQVTIQHQPICSQSNSSADYLSPNNSFSAVITNNNVQDTGRMGSTAVVSKSSKDIIFHCPITNNNNGIQHTFIPYEVFTPMPLPMKISDKWLAGKMDKKKKINVGLDYQAELPCYRGNKARIKTYKSLGEKLWDPRILDVCTFDEVDKYLEFACCSAVPGGGANKEYALHLLTLSRGNIREAVLRLMEKLPSLPPKLRNYYYVENQRWSSEEIMTFQICLVQAGKDFSRIAKAVGTKCQAECVCFYYFWKKVCGNEYQVMRQIWKDRLEQQRQLQLQSHDHQNNSTNINNNNVSFLVPVQEFRGA